MEYRHFIIWIPKIKVYRYNFCKLRKGPKFPGEVFWTPLVVICPPPHLWWSNQALWLVRGGRKLPSITPPTLISKPWLRYFADVYIFFQIFCFWPVWKTLILYYYRLFIRLKISTWPSARKNYTNGSVLFMSTLLLLINPS